MNIGPTIRIRGELTGNEDMVFDGEIDGKIDLADHSLTIGQKGRVKAAVRAKAVIIQGEIEGNINATQKVELAQTGRVLGDIVAPRILIADGARFKGSVDMTQGEAAAEQKTHAAAPGPVEVSQQEKHTAKAGKTVPIRRGPRPAAP